jgi:hypothetical protein
MGIGGFAAMRALSTRNDEPERASRPFDKDRDGFVCGEGSGILVLEELEFAKKRGATIYAEVAGYGLSGDAYHLTSQPEDANGAVRSMRMALRKAGVRPEEVDYINAHGTSTPINDPTETLAVKTTFGDHARKLVMSSTKSMTGHLLARPADSRPASRPSRSGTRSRRRRSISIRPIRPATSTTRRRQAAHAYQRRAVQLIRVRRHERHTADEEDRLMRIAVCIKQVVTVNGRSASTKRRRGSAIRTQVGS